LSGVDRAVGPARPAAPISQSAANRAAANKSAPISARRVDAFMRFAFSTNLQTQRVLSLSKDTPFGKLRERASGGSG
jgi:hypothetical protein